MSDTNTVTVKHLRKLLQNYNDTLGQYINGEERFKLGRVLTIIDASIGDAEQRKAIKDLVQNEWWGGNSAKPTDCPMDSPHADLRAICVALGFELYDDKSGLAIQAAQPFNHNDWAVKRYTKILKED